MKPVVFDGIVYVLIQCLLVLSTQFGTDEAAKYISPVTLFWLKIGIAEGAAAVLAIKLFRSETYARYKANGGSNGNGNGKTLPLPDVPPLAAVKPPPIAP